MNYFKAALRAHKKHKGKISIKSKMPVKTRDDLATAYSPGVGQPCLEIAKNPNDVYKYTSKGNIVAVISDGSAVLGLGNIGAAAGLPVMEGKSILFKEFANVDAFPIVIDSNDPKTIINTAKLISPGLGGINLEDISAPRCFEIEEQLKKALDIPVFHDDQHGTAIVVAAGLINGLKLANKKLQNIKIVINGAGAAGSAIAILLNKMGAKNIIVCDSRGTMYKNRPKLNKYKNQLLKFTNKQNIKGTVHEAIVNADVFIGVSKANLLTATDVRTMANKPIIFGLANPVPEILPKEAKKGGAFIVATGRSDFANQVNNVLVFPGLFRGTLDEHAKTINYQMKIAAANAVAKHIKKPTPENILPYALDKSVATSVAKAVKKAAKDTGVSRKL